MRHAWSRAAMPLYLVSAVFLCGAGTEAKAQYSRKTPIVEGKDHEFEFHERLPRPGEPPLVSGRYDVRISWIHGGVHMPDGSDFPLTGTTGTVEVR